MIPITDKTQYIILKNPKTIFVYNITAYDNAEKDLNDFYDFGTDPEIYTFNLQKTLIHFLALNVVEGLNPNNIVFMFENVHITITTSLIAEVLLTACIELQEKIKTDKN